MWQEVLEESLKGKKFVKFETKNGFHYIVPRTYDANKLLSETRWFYDEKNIDFPIEVKDNGIALVYYNNEV